MSDEKVTRFEVVDEHGRVYVRWGCSVELSRQDGGRTLKVFISQRPESEEIRYAPGAFSNGEPQP